jgi:aryl-alcohol dehydrogenase-like predicted oxidoreductase
MTVCENWGTETMEYRTLGQAGVRVSPLCLGTMMFGGPTEEADSIRIVHRALDAGINFIDTANVYNAGESERIVGRALRGKRDSVVLATKVRNSMGDGPNAGGNTRYHIMTEVEASLRRLETDRIDLYFLHRPDEATPIEESLRALDDCVRQGKVRYIGCSNFYAWQILQGLWVSDRRNLERFVCLQSLYNIVNRDVEVEVLPACGAHGIAFVPYSPLARGVLSGKYRPGEPFPEGSRAARQDKRMRETELREESYRVAQELLPLAEARGKTLTQFALAWLLANPLVTSPILGPRTMTHLEDNLGALGWSLTAEEEAAVDRLVPPGEHTGYGFNDPLYPVQGRPARG